MHATRLAAVAAIPLAAAAISFATASGGGAHQNQAGRTITLQQGEFGPGSFDDAAPLSPTRDQDPPRFRTSAGDHLYLSAPLLTAVGGPRVGRIELEITALRGQGDAVVTLTHGVIRLKDGDMILEGSGPSAVEGLAVTGGTGAYAAARGTANQDDNGLDTITLLP